MMFRTIAVAALMSLAATGAQAQNVEAGKKVFKKCAACHFADKEKNKIGPHLVGIVGRPAGAVEGFKYSKALMEKANEGLVWTPEAITEYLKKPSAMIKKTKMTFPGLKKPEDLADIMAYLETLKAE